MSVTPTRVFRMAAAGTDSRTVYTHLLWLAREETGAGKHKKKTYWRAT
jgi:hypothetical protein